MITVKEYIEREAIIQEIKEAKDNFSPTMRPVFDVATHLISHAPAAKVKPIETAYWDWHHDGTHFCSECGNDAPLRYVDEYCSKYCPHCGRLMTHVAEPSEEDMMWNRRED